MLFESSYQDVPHRPTAAEPRQVVDGLVVGREVWLVVARCGEDISGWLHPDRDEAPLVLCRSLGDGRGLVLGESDPDRDALLSELTRRDWSAED